MASNTKMPKNSYGFWAPPPRTPPPHKKQKKNRLAVFSKNKIWPPPKKYDFVDFHFFRHSSSFLGTCEFLVTPMRISIENCAWWCLQLLKFSKLKRFDLKSDLWPRINHLLSLINRPWDPSRSIELENWYLQNGGIKKLTRTYLMTHFMPKQAKHKARSGLGGSSTSSSIAILLMIIIIIIIISSS